MKSGNSQSIFAKTKHFFNGRTRKCNRNKLTQSQSNHSVFSMRKLLPMNFNLEFFASVFSCLPIECFAAIKRQTRQRTFEKKTFIDFLHLQWPIYNSRYPLVTLLFLTVCRLILCSNPMWLMGASPRHALSTFSMLARCLERALTTGSPLDTNGALHK